MKTCGGGGGVGEVLYEGELGRQHCDDEGSDDGSGCCHDGDGERDGYSYG